MPRDRVELRTIGGLQEWLKKFVACYDCTHAGWNYGSLHHLLTEAQSALAARERQRDLVTIFEAACKWHDFQSSENTNNLYNLMSRVRKSKFDPAEYDNVE